MPPKKVWQAERCKTPRKHNIAFNSADAPQGKGTKSKKLNETDEEKAARLANEAAAAQEGARRREEAARLATKLANVWCMLALLLSALVMKPHSTAATNVTYYDPKWQDCATTQCT